MNPWRQAITGHVTLASLNAHIFSGEEGDKTPLAMDKILHQAGYKLSQEELNDPKHELIDQLFDIHERGEKHRRITRTGKLILYPSPGYRVGPKGELITVWGALDIDLDKSSDSQKPHEETYAKQLARADLINKAYQVIGVKPVFAFSWHWGLHCYTFYDEPVPVGSAYMDLFYLRDYLYKVGIFPELDKEFKLKDNKQDRIEKIELRPRIQPVGPAELISKLRCLGAPYHSCFDRKFMVFNAD